MKYGQCVNPNLALIFNKAAITIRDESLSRPDQRRKLLTSYRILLHPTHTTQCSHSHPW